MDRPLHGYVLLYLKGLCMGAADVVPGVSGGTIAFISGIYDELVDSIRRANPAALKVLFQQGPGAFWRHINGSFLVVLIAGILTSMFSLARVVEYTLSHHPLLIWAFFLGLIVASVIYVGRQQPHWRLSQWVGLAAGTLVALFCAFSPPLDVGGGGIIVFLSGMVAICAMILPGISGSFILLLMGMYPLLIGALTGPDFGFLALFASGAVIGLMLFSQLLSWLLHHHRATTLSVLIGFLVGSLAVVWPWTVAAGSVASGLAVGTRQLMMPWTYEAVVGPALILECVLLAVFGLVLVLGLEYIGQNGFKRRGEECCRR